jgi:hypothetical protein
MRQPESASILGLGMWTAITIMQAQVLGRLYSQNYIIFHKESETKFIFRNIFDF